MSSTCTHHRVSAYEPGGFLADVASLQAAWWPDRRRHSATCTRIFPGYHPGRRYFFRWFVGLPATAENSGGKRGDPAAPGWRRFAAARQERAAGVRRARGRGAAGGPLRGDAADLGAGGGPAGPGAPRVERPV